MLALFQTEGPWDAEEEMPGFQYKRDFGDYISEQMGEKDQKWVTDQVMSIEVLDMMENLKKAKFEMVDGHSSARLG